ncbi:DoxX family protein [Halomarina pelagica]|uniref:DoxX family protein n=1 Tax=Halomarina pelagica TaxID=2961599 RepID=UPI0020C2E589|nr:DoxX family membrane protein [Halomarina sp. BND7]
MRSSIARTASLLVAFLSVAFLGASGVASAHVRYVVDRGAAVEALRFLVETLSNPFNLFVLGAGAVGLLAALGAYLWVRPLGRDVDAVRGALAGYDDLLPWLFRLSLGLPLVGAGFNGYYFSPLVHAEAFAPAFGDLSGVFVRLFGLAVGFLLLFGLATRLVALVGLAAYLAGVVAFPALLLAFEYVPGFVAIALLGGGRPSADDLIAAVAADERTAYSRVDPVYRRLAVPLGERIEPYTAFVPTVVRVGLGLAFAYLGLVEKLMNPGVALAVVAKYDLTAVVPVGPELWVVGAGLVEILVGVMLVLGLFTRAFSAVAFLLLTTTLFGLPDDPVLAHVSLFGLTSALLITGAGPFSVDGWLHETIAGRRAVAAETD